MHCFQENKDKRVQNCMEHSLAFLLYLVRTREVETKSGLWCTIPAKIHGLNFKFII